MRASPPNPITSASSSRQPNPRLNRRRIRIRNNSESMASRMGAPSPCALRLGGGLADPLLRLEQLAQVAGELVGTRPDLDGAVRQQQVLLLDHPGDQAGPARLVARADAGPVVAVEVLVKED